MHKERVAAGQEASVQGAKPEYRGCWDTKATQRGQDPRKEGTGMEANMMPALQSRRLATFREAEHESGYLEDSGNRISHY